MVAVNGRNLLLGEDEEFSLVMPLWNDHLLEVVSNSSNADFAKFSASYNLVQDFLDKFRDMKQAFRYQIGDAKEMAKGCFENLKSLQDRLENSEGISLARRLARYDEA